jgi:lipopolysaccharide transport system ATP-binding protein
MSAVIKVENLSKQYRLGQVGTGTISHDVNRWWHKIRGKEDPYLKIGESNDRTIKGASDYVWALKDINFEVKQGEVLGVIGRNGAGKSTLLKILSRTTAPTTGSVKIKGRVASLLEVGTGFHPELSGRDNIFLNGAILGMTRREIQNKFDEIVDFAGVERYIDTPVKRYSSGMYVRLAFAVAAHLEPEILIVDEVLAVGDAEFQKKALGKMQDVSNKEGRTVLFVSHNLPAIKQLCNTGLYLVNGIESSKGEINEVLEQYQVDTHVNEELGSRQIIEYVNGVRMIKWGIGDCSASLPDKPFSAYSGKPLLIECIMESDIETEKGEIGLNIRDDNGILIYSLNNRDYEGAYLELNIGQYKFDFTLNLPIKNGSYQLEFVFAADNKIIDQWESKTSLIILNEFQLVNSDRWVGVITNKFDFNYQLLK